MPEMTQDYQFGWRTYRLAAHARGYFLHGTQSQVEQLDASRVCLAEIASLIGKARLDTLAWILLKRVP